MLLFCLFTPTIKYFKIFWCIQSFAFQHVIFLILNKISLLCKYFRDRKRGWGWKKPPPNGSFWRIFLLYKQNYISNVGRVFDMLNNLHVWVFVKWELKELNLGVKKSQVSGIWKKIRIKESMSILVISKKPHTTVGFHKNPEKRSQAGFWAVILLLQFEIWVSRPRQMDRRDLGFRTLINGQMGSGQAW